MAAKCLIPSVFSTCRQVRARKERASHGQALEVGRQTQVGLTLSLALYTVYVVVLPGTFSYARDIHPPPLWSLSGLDSSASAPACSRGTSDARTPKRCASRCDRQRHVQPWAYGIHSVQCCLASPSASANHEAAVPTRTCSSFPSRRLRFNGSPSPSVRRGPYTWLHHGIRRSGHQLDSA